MAQEALCLDHYIERVFARLHEALDLCQQGQPADLRTLHWLSDADFAVQLLSQSGQERTPAQRSQLLQLLLGLANLHEYLRHHSVVVKSTG